MNLRLDFGGTLILISHTRSRCFRVTSSPGITFTSVTSLCMVLWERMHGPTEKDEVYPCGYLPRLVRDEMDVVFLGTCVPKKQVECYGIL